MKELWLTRLLNLSHGLRKCQGSSADVRFFDIYRETSCYVTSLQTLSTAPVKVLRSMLRRMDHGCSLCKGAEQVSPLSDLSQLEVSVLS